MDFFAVFAGIAFARAVGFAVRARRWWPLAAGAAVLLFSVPCFAVGETDTLSYLKSAVEEVFPAAAENTPQAVGSKAIWEMLLAAFRGVRSDVSSFLLYVCGLSLLAVPAEIFSQQDTTPTVRRALGALYAVALSKRLLPVFSAAASSLSEATELYAALCPVMCAVSLAGGATATAAQESATFGLTLQLTQLFSTRLLLPAAGGVYALNLLGTLGENDGVAALAARLRRIFITGIGLVGALLGALLSAQTLLAGATDGAALRAAKYAVAGMIPIAGQTVSAALSTLSAGLLTVQGSIGIGFVPALLAIVLPPLLQLLLFRAALDAAATFLGLFSDGRGIAACAGALRDSLDTMIAALSVSTLLYLLQTVVFLRNGLPAVS